MLRRQYILVCIIYQVLSKIYVYINIYMYEAFMYLPSAVYFLYHKNVYIGSLKISL